jgi:hypothetical protein
MSFKTYLAYFDNGLITIKARNPSFRGLGLGGQRRNAVGSSFVGLKVYQNLLLHLRHRLASAGDHFLFRP